jgi:hypothetical protein
MRDALLIIVLLLITNQTNVMTNKKKAANLEEKQAVYDYEIIRSVIYMVTGVAGVLMAFIMKWMMGENALEPAGDMPLSKIATAAVGITRVMDILIIVISIGVFLFGIISLCKTILKRKKSGV